MSEQLESNSERPASPCTVNLVSAERWTRQAESGLRTDLDHIFRARLGYQTFLKKHPEAHPNQRAQIAADIAFIDVLIAERELRDPSFMRRIGAVVIDHFHVITQKYKSPLQ